jgi:lysophospholipase L1-like esterase
MSQQLTRREFVATASGAVGLALWPGLQRMVAESAAPQAPPVVLFQGDSITASGRSSSQTEPNKAAALGTGYPLPISAGLLHNYPTYGIWCFNRGVSGDSVPDLQARWETDTIALKPVVLSVLVGVNDFMHELDDGVGTVEDYEAGYTALLESTRAALPHILLAVLEPFALRTGMVDSTWFPAFDEYRAAAARVAQRVGALFIPLQQMFDDLSKLVAPAYWAADGVHPTLAGHNAIAECWREMAGL